MALQVATVLANRSNDITEIGWRQVVVDGGANQELQPITGRGRMTVDTVHHTHQQLHLHVVARGGGGGGGSGGGGDGGWGSVDAEPQMNGA